MNSRNCTMTMLIRESRHSISCLWTKRFMSTTETDLMERMPSPSLSLKCRQPSIISQLWMPSQFSYHRPADQFWYKSPAPSRLADRRAKPSSKHSLSLHKRPNGKSSQTASDFRTEFAAKLKLQFKINLCL